MLDIFISIACYRDSEVVPTIRDAYEKAANRDRLVFGVYAQMHENDGDIDLSFLPDEQVRLLLKCMLNLTRLSFIKKHNLSH